MITMEELTEAARVLKTAHVALTDAAKEETAARNRWSKAMAAHTEANKAFSALVEKLAAQA